MDNDNTDNNHSDPFIRKFGVMGAGHLSDEILAVAYNFQSALEHVGAVPGKDYSRLELFQLAAPVVAAMFQTGRIGEYDYPSDQLLKGRAKPA